ncbi:MAG: hypothetical protein ACE5GJ_06885 [Gemmatimonadota bacterium]
MHKGGAVRQRPEVRSGGQEWAPPASRGGCNAGTGAVERRTEMLGGPGIYRAAFERQHLARKLLEDILREVEKPRPRSASTLGERAFRELRVS